MAGTQTGRRNRLLTGALRREQPPKSMKHSLAALLFLASAALADVDIDRKIAASLKTYDCGEIEAKGHELIGKIIRIRFYRRDAEVSQEDGANRGLVHSFSTSNRPNAIYGYVRVVVPNDGMPWFTKLPTDFRTRGPSVVIARLDKGGSIPEATLLGREIKTDAKGSRIVW